MTRNSSSSLGINVLSGLVKVERGNEASRNGLVGMPDTPPLSVSSIVKWSFASHLSLNLTQLTHLRVKQQVRVFGVPVFERGQRVREPKQEPIKPIGGNQPPTGAGDGPEIEEALPI